MTLAEKLEMLRGYDGKRVNIEIWLIGHTKQREELNGYIEEVLHHDRDADDEKILQAYNKLTALNAELESKQDKLKEHEGHLRSLYLSTEASSHLSETVAAY